MSLSMTGIYAILFTLCIISFYFVIFHNKNTLERDLPILGKVSCIIFALLPTIFCIPLGLYIVLRKKGVDGNKIYKFNNSTKNFGKVLIAVSIISIIAIRIILSRY